MSHLARFVPLVFLVLACLVLPQQASAQQQQTTLSTPSAAPNPVTEGGSVFFVYQRSLRLDRALGLDVDYGGTADPETDLGSDRPITASIGNGNITGGIFVPIADDDTVEGDETLIVTITEDTASEGFTTGPATFAAVTITDTDTASVSLSSTAPPPAAEGGTITFTVELDNPVAETFSLGWTASDGTATVNDDLVDQSGTVVIDANSRTATFTVPVASDDEAEDSETFTVALTGAPIGLVNIAPNRITVDSSTATGTIAANTATPLPTVDIGIAPASATEGGDIRFTVSLSAALLEPRTLDIGYTAGTGNTGAGLDDLGSARPTTLTLPSGTRSVDLVVPTVDDNDDEENETFTVTLSLPDPPADPRNTLTLTTATATGTINDNDDTAPPGDNAVIDLSAGEASEADNRLTFRVDLTEQLSQDITVAWAVTGGTATAADFTQYAASGTATIKTGDDVVRIRFRPVDDDDVEGPETLELTISADPENPLPEGVTIGTAMATSTLTDNDAPTGGDATVSIGNRTVAEDVAGGNATFTVNLSRAVDGDVTLDVAVTAGASNPVTLADDLGTLPTTVTIAEGAIEATITVPITNDAIVEGNETFTVTLSEDPANPLPEGVTITTSEATGTITDADTANVSLSSTPPPAAEGGTITFTVELDNPVAERFSLGWTASDGTATVNDDLDDQSGTVMIAASDDPAVDAMVSIANATAVAENGGGSARFKVSLDRAVDSDVVLDIAYTAGSAALGDLGNGRPTTVTISRGDIEATLTVPIVYDVVVEDDETFTVTLTTATAGVGIAAGTATGTITDGDTALVLMQGGTIRASESRPFSYFVRLGAPVSRPVTIAWTAVSGTATVEDDLQEPRTGTVTFPANNTAARAITVRPVDDTADEPDETFMVTIKASGTLPDRVTVDPARNSRTSTIVDNDDSPPPPPVVNATVSIDSETVAEDGGTVTFTAKLSRAVTSDVVLDVAVTAGPGDTAILADDLGTPLPTRVTINASTTEATFTVPIANDGLVEGNETFTVTLSENATTGLPDGVTIPTGTATGTIEDDDRGTVTLDPPTLTADEDGTFTWTVRLSRAAEDAVTVRWTATAEPGDTATVTEDLQETTGTVTFLANTNTNRTFTIRPVNDTDDEDNETFTVTLEVDTQGGNPLPTGVTIGTNNRSTATITDDDDAPPVNATVSIADADSVAEGAGPARFTISLGPQALTSAAVLNVVYAPGTTNPATPADDLGADRPATVTIPAGRRSVVLKVPIADDDLDENNETFTVTLSAATEQPDTPETGRPPAFVLLFSRATATGTIAATDEPSVLIEPRRIGAGTALRRHVGRFDTMTGTVVRSRLRGSIMKTLTLSENIGSGAAAAGGRLGKTRWGSWIDGSWAGFGGKATGRQADVYGGFDFLGGNGKWLIGALAGHEVADLRIGKATYSASYTHLGLYGGVRLSDRLVFDGALTYGRATTEVTLGDVSASYDANRITARIALTGDFGLIHGLGTGSVKVEPQVGLLYSREALGAFTDSAGGVAGGEVLELGRFSFGPRLTRDFDWGQVVGGARVQWDFLQIEDGVDGRLSGAADIGLRFGLAPGVTLGVHGDVDGIGITDGFGSLGGRVQLDARF